jgi:hypothetical protein
VWRYVFVTQWAEACVCWRPATPFGILPSGLLLAAIRAARASTSHRHQPAACRLTRGAAEEQRVATVGDYFATTFTNR